ncbi:MAG: AMP-binding protein [Planctomycetota bacterium]|nr:AMP-binding protein [Planctomycetota bacterium]
MSDTDPTTGLEPPATLPDALERAAERWGERGIGMIDNRGRLGELRGFATLHQRAGETAARLQGLGVGEREPILVCLPTSEEFLDAWFGAVLLGAWPVAIGPPGGMGATDFQLRRIDSVRERIGARRVICRTAVRDEARRLGLEELASSALSPEELAAAEPAAAPARSQAGPGDVAFLQLTSGSTGVQRAVMITHRGAVHNPLAIQAALTESLGASLPSLGGTGVSWLPLHHDMGLVGCVLASLVGATDLWLSSPRTFLGRPHTWLRNISAFATTLAPAPNFGYQTCVEQIKEEKLDGVDLSGWRAAMTGAEMIRSETMLGFAERFEHLGFSPKAFMPCYGLAEATLAVTFDTSGLGVRTRRVPDEPDEKGSPARQVTCVGPPVIDTEVAICAPDGAPLPDGVVGEVRVRGPGVFAGYHRDPEATAEALRDGWLVTGDLGFVQDGELHVTGRNKDILIVNGQNLMPHELEWLAEEVAGGGGATRAGAFSIVCGNEGEKAVLAVEVAGVADGKGDALRELDRGIRIRIARVLAIPLADLVFVRRGRLPKTTSGKVQRGELRRQYERGELERI